MNVSMKAQLSALVLALAVGSTLAFAAPTMAPASGTDIQAVQKDRKPRESFTEETVRKTADGKTSKRKVEQKVSDNGFTRKEQITNAEGKIATKEVTASYDKESGKWSRKVEGTGFDGKTWSRSQEGQGGPGDHRHNGKGKHRGHHDGKQAGMTAE